MKERKERGKYGVVGGGVRGEQEWRSFEVMAGWLPFQLMG